MDLFNPETVKGLVGSGTGASVGALILAITKPEKNWKRWALKTFVATAVGTIFGAAIAQRFQFEQLLVIACGCTLAIMSKDVLGYLELKGENLKKGSIDIPLEGK
jgi:zinc transporter ZupT